MSRDLLRSLVQLYVAVAYRPDRVIDVDEADAIVAMLHAWLPPSEHASVEDELEAAIRLERRSEAMSVEGLVCGLRQGLDEAERALVFADLDRIALADGERSEPEAALIALARETWAAGC